MNILNITNRVLFFCCLCALITAAGCAPVYVPNARHTNLMDKRGEASASGYAGVNGTDIQLAYAVSDDIGLLAAGSFGENESKTSDDYHKHKYGELGMQYQQDFGIGRVEVIGGFGKGSATSVDTYEFITESEVQATGQYNKLFLQPNIGLETNLLDAGLALRLGHVIFTEFETSSDRYTENQQSTFFEPAVFARMGWKNVKLEAQVGATKSLQHETEVAFDYILPYMSMGIRLNMNLIGQ